MEFLREFTIEVYMDTNKETYEKTFNLVDYDNIAEVVEAVKKYCKELSELLRS